MSTEYRRNSPESPGPGMLWPLLAAAGVVLALVLALPALVIGLALHRLAARRSWGIPSWFVPTCMGGGLVCYLYAHGLDRMVATQLEGYALAIKLHGVVVARWALLRLWSETWPVWLRTLPAAPFVALRREMEASGHGGAARFLNRQERARQRRLARSKSIGKRRARRTCRIPDAAEGHMVVLSLVHGG